MLELPVKLAAYLGLRRSEICGLRWENINLEAGLLSIQEARTEIGGVVVQKSPKTRKSIRRLGIAGLQDLKRILQRAWERRRSNDPKEWVVLRPDGTPPKPDQLTQNLLMVVRKTGCQGFLCMASGIVLPLLLTARGFRCLTYPGHWDIAPCQSPAISIRTSSTKQKLTR